jgi:hypothetical protein
MKTNRTTMVLVVLVGLLLAQDALAFYNPQAGRWLNRDPVEELGGVNLYGFVRDNPLSYSDANGLVAKKCGVESFSVKWRQGITDKSGRPLGLFRIDVKIVFKKGGDYDPRCCEYKQNARTRFKITIPNSVPSPWEGDEPMHDDDYSRGDDIDGNTSLGDPSFQVNDNPGPTDLPLPDGSEIIYYEFTAEQIVFSSGKNFKGGLFSKSCECEANAEVAKKGPHTATVSGKTGSYKYEGVPADL